MGRRTVRALGILCVTAAVCLQTAAASAQVGYTGSLYFARVEMSDGSRSDAVYILNSLDAERGRFRASVTIPVIAQRSAWPGSDTTWADTPWQTGISDPTFRVDVLAWQVPAQGLSVRPSVSIKVPVGRVEDGLSSGEADYAVGVSLTRVRGRNSVLADVTYWVIGDAPDVDVRNITSFYAGFGRVLDAGYRWSLVVSASGAPSVVTGAEPSAQLGAALLRSVNPRAALAFSLSAGLTESAADLAFGATWRLMF